MRRPALLASVILVASCVEPSKAPPTNDVGAEETAHPDVVAEGVRPVGCTPGRVKTCPCDGAPTLGRQTCLADGTFGACMCSEAPRDAALADAVAEAVADVDVDAAADASIDLAPDAIADAGPDAGAPFPQRSGRSRARNSPTNHVAGVAPLCTTRRR